MKTVITYCVLLFSVSFCYGQKENPIVKGTIANYANQPLYIYKCGVFPAIGGSDTLLFIDSTITDKKGKFVFSNPKMANHRDTENTKNHREISVKLRALCISVVNNSKIPNPILDNGLYRINLLHNQWFYKFQEKQKH